MGVTDDVIDLGEYLKRREGAEEAMATFTLWGADGERSRFALPLWRAIYIATAERGGILWQDREGPELRPFVVLDLASETARLDFPFPDDAVGGEADPPHVSPASEHGLAVYLGQDGEERRWFLVLAAGPEGILTPEGRDREDILFLAGECAGLLFLRGFADEGR